MNKTQQHLQLLGLNVKDRVTDFKGVVVCVSFDLYGCIQATVQPTALDNEGKTQNGRWFDVSRLQIVSDTPVMDRPDYIDGPIAEGKHGPAEKPARD